MHPRFEIRLLTDTIVGECPPVTILRLAWEDKRDYLDAWMQQYYRIHGDLPRGRCELGKTPRHGLLMGTVDFAAARERLARRLARDGYREWRRKLRGLLVAWIARLRPGFGFVASRLPADDRLL